MRGLSGELKSFSDSSKTWKVTSKSGISIVRVKLIDQISKSLHPRSPMREPTYESWGILVTGRRDTCAVSTQKTQSFAKPLLKASLEASTGVKMQIQASPP